LTSSSADELVDVAEYGAVTIMPVRLYLKEATWCVFDRFATTTTTGDAAEDALRTLFVGKVRMWIACRFSKLLL
jgi:hypothetical protein